MNFPGFKAREDWQHNRNVIDGSYIGGGQIRYKGDDEITGEPRFLVILQKRPGREDEWYKTRTVHGMADEALRVLESFYQQWKSGEASGIKKTIGGWDARGGPKRRNTIPKVHAPGPWAEEAWAVPEGLPPLAGSVRAKSGATIDTTARVWNVPEASSKRVVATLTAYRLWEVVTARGTEVAEGQVFLAHAVLLFLEKRIRKVSGATAAADISELVLFFKATRARSDAPCSVAYLTRQNVAVFAEEHSYRGRLLTFYKWAYARRFPGFEARRMRALDQVPRGGAAIGRAIRSNNPRKGAFTWDESHFIGEALKAPPHDVDPVDRLVTWLFHDLGVRSITLLNIRKEDLRVSPSGKGILRLKRVKQRGEGDRYFDRSISPGLTSLILVLIDEIEGEWLVPGEEFESGWGKAAIKRFFEAADLVTTRLSDDGEPRRLPASVYRFRYTMASKMAEEGFGPEQIAALLDDTTLTMALIYVENTPSLVEKLKESVDRHPAFVRQMKLFKGGVAEEKSLQLPVVVGGADQYRNFEEFADVGPIGWCSNPDPCDLRPPISCYRCAFFLAAPDPAQHQKQFNQLVDELDRIGKDESDRMAKVVRPDLFAIQEVITQTKGGRTARERLSEAISEGRA